MYPDDRNLAADEHRIDATFEDGEAETLAHGLVKAAGAAAIVLSIGAVVTGIWWLAGWLKEALW